MRDEKRNLFLMFIDTVLFVNAMTFLSIHAVITLFLSELGASTLDIGIANALVSVGSFVTQPVFARQVMNLAGKLKRFVHILLTQRLVFLLFIMAVPVLAPAYPQAMIFVFLAGWAVFNAFVGAYNPFYMSLFAKMIAVHHRGRLRGYSGAAANLLALGSAYATGLLLSKVPYPYNYTLIFAIGTALLILDALVFALMREQPDEVRPVEMNYFQYFARIPAMFRANRKYFRIVGSFACMVVSQVSLAYYALYAIRVFEASAVHIAWFTALTGIVQIAGSLIFGILADRFDHRLVLLIACLCGGAAGWLTFGVHALWAVFTAFALTNLCLCGYNLSSSILIIEQVDKKELAMGISINITVTLVVSALVTVGSSFLVDVVSFKAVFLIAGVFGSIGYLALLGHRQTARTPKPE